MIIVNYHNILDRSPNPFNSLVRKEWGFVEDFEEQIVELCEKFRIVPLEEMALAIQNQEVIPWGCAITFDDGYLGAYQYAAPVLERYGVPATFFIITHKVRGSANYEPSYFDRLEAQLQLTVQGRLNLAGFGLGVYLLNGPESKAAFLREFRQRIKVTPASQREQIENSLENQFGVHEVEIADYLQHEAFQKMTWEEIRDLRERGFSIGAHTRTHPSLSQVDDSQLEFEIHGSLLDLKEQLGLDSIAFSYPFGKREHISKAAIKVARDAGFTCAVTMKRGVNTAGINLFKLRRMSFSRLKRSYWDGVTRGEVARDFQAPPATFSLEDEV